LRKPNISMMYPKFAEKSRSPQDSKNPDSKNPGLKEPEGKRFFLVIFIMAAAIIAGHGIRNMITSAAPGKITLIFGLSGKDPETARALGAIVEAFEEAHPEIRIVLSETAGTLADTLADTQTETGGGADILMFDEAERGALIREGSLSSLDPWLRRETGIPQWAVPLVSFMDLLFYNIDLLAGAGFDRPPKDRDEFLRYAAAVAGKHRSGRSGAALSLGAEDPLGIRRDVFSWIRAAGAPLVTEGRPSFTGRETARVLDFLGDLSRQGLLAPGAFTETGTARLEAFEKGDIALMIGSSSAIKRLRETMGNSFGIGAVPGSPGGGVNGGKPVFSLHSLYAAISSRCRYPDEAWTFLSFLADQNSVLAAELQAIPGSGSLDFTANAAGIPSYIENDPLLLKAWDMYEAADIVRDFEELPEAEALEQALREELPPLLEGRRNGTDTAAAIQKKWGT
jgi:ABC-type glycerol-3-phosphate transport system substrate-binding protein